MTDSFDRYVAIYKLGCRWEIDAAKKYANTAIDSQEPTNEEQVKMILVFTSTIGLRHPFKNLCRGT